MYVNNLIYYVNLRGFSFFIFVSSFIRTNTQLNLLFVPTYNTLIYLLIEICVFKIVGMLYFILLCLLR